MEVCFTFKGHPAIRATHSTTLEITKDIELTTRGDCIVGVGADFDSAALQAMCRSGKVMELTLEVEGITETIRGTANPAFSDQKEIVVRMGDFASPRTLMIHADKSAKQLSRRMVDFLRNTQAVGRVSISRIE